MSDTRGPSGELLPSEEQLERWGSLISHAAIGSHAPIEVTQRDWNDLNRFLSIDCRFAIKALIAATPPLESNDR